MSKTLSLKMRDDVFEETEQVLHDLQLSRNAYINNAVELYNRLHRRGTLRKQMVKESRAAYATSAEVLEEFEQLQDETAE